MTNDSVIFRDLVEGGLTITVNDFGGYTHSTSDVIFPFKGKIINFSNEDCEVLNLDNGKKYSIYSVSVDEYNTRKYSNYVWDSLAVYFRIKFIIDYPEYQEQSYLIEEVEDLMEDIKC